VQVYLDAGHLPPAAVSSIVDVTAEHPRLLRLGALDAARLREVVPDLVDPAGVPSTGPAG
jgi:tRNA A37 threonylcarbamoyladenosine synthetase subunit TsaC/SUA5/YrdC